MSKFIIKVLFRDNANSCFFDLNNNAICDGDSVVVSTDKGEMYGFASGSPIEISENDSILLEGVIIRKSTKEDNNIYKKNCEDSKNSIKKAQTIANELSLNMRFITSYFTFDRSQLILTFTADDRIDFRELAKRLASIYKTRIELRQIGVRDKAKMVGGIGPCGRFLCCNLFLNDFESVSINMAKNQYISLKPDKINGVCGRLLCCLNYEDKQYTELKKDFPKISSHITYQGKKGKVISCNLLSKTFTVENEDKTIQIINIGEYESNK